MQTYAFEVVEGLARHGHRAVVFTRFDAPTGDCGAALVRRELRANRAEDSSLLRAHEGQFDVWHVMNAAYSWIALELSPVLVSVHGNDFLAPNPVAGFSLRSRLGLPFGSRLDFILARWRTSRLLKRAMPRVDHAIANSRFTLKLLLAAYPSLRGKSSYAHPGVASRYMELPPEALGRPPRGRLLTVARLEDRRKNVHRVLEALAHLKEDFRFSYQVVGDGVLRPWLESLTAEYELSDRVTFLGAVPQGQLIELYRESDLMVLPSSQSSSSVEGFGIVYLEANACGTPVLGARLGGAAEAVDHGVSGILVDEPTVSAIREALAAFFAGHLKLRPLACRRHAERFSWDSLVEHTLFHYREALGRHDSC